MPLIARQGRTTRENKTRQAKTPLKTPSLILKIPTWLLQRQNNFWKSQDNLNSPRDADRKLKLHRNWHNIITAGMDVLSPSWKREKQFPSAIISPRKEFECLVSTLERCQMSMTKINGFCQQPDTKIGLSLKNAASRRQTHRIGSTK